ncbi:GtrA family protein [Paenibacillus sp. JGP012]|uniref:GtrA family protein n=1 Tax=Paenibacillus sp. JGP012 TaxID=2735914 RepID=UPI0016123445|nr:GtrA family protein [Paenibacillus sp. JGP012]
MIIAEEKDETIIFIPSLEPDDRLLSYVRQLQKYGFTKLVIVDDGSGENYKHIFENLEHIGCSLLYHEENLGKGEALKTGFRYIAQHYGDAHYVVTADSDGQHAAEDVYRIAQEAKRRPNDLLLGVRDFSAGDIPPKSLFGNRMTSFIFALLYGKKLSDTQTGLRAFGTGLLSFMLDVHGKRFEYELQMLISCIQSGIAIHTVPIQVIYENGNAGTHFKAIQDSARVMGVLFSNFFRFISSSVASSVVDLGIAWFLIDSLRPMMGDQHYLRILLATVIARVISIVVNYVLNRHFVFRKEDSRGSLWRYLTLCGLIIILSSTGVYLFHTLFQVDEKAAKFFCDALLFLLSFQLQRRWVFAARRKQL